MSGQERQRKARTADSKPTEIKQASPLKPASQQRTTTRGRKTQDPGKPSHVEEKPCVKETSNEKTAQHATRESDRERRTPAGRTETKTCSAKSVIKAPGDSPNSQMETPKKCTKTPLAATKPKACGKKESQTNLPKAGAGMEDEQPQKERTQRSVRRTKSTAEKSTDEICADKTMQKMKAKAGSDETVLQSILEKLKIKTKDRSDACKVVNEFIDNLIKFLKKETICFKDVEDPVRTGSYYENLKISDPDEFDVMLPMPVDRVHIKPFGTSGAFYSVALKRDNNPLQKFQQSDILSASEMLTEFRKAVKEFAKGFPVWTMTRKEKGCPAVTLTMKVGQVPISLDVVLCLKVKSSWPSFTSDGLKIEQWLGSKVKQEYKWKPYYLVPKYEGRGHMENGGVQAKDTWRVSFSHIEKDIMKKHGSEKTCCEKDGARCCRKDCLKLLKHLLHLLKESNSSFDKFCSYHAKTTLLTACCSRNKDSDWKASNLNHCFNQLLQDFESHLRRAELYNFFIPSQNLLSGPGKNLCKSLADSIREQRENGFPIFVKDLDNPH